jgi:F420H(2)-dependent quinone reductase
MNADVARALALTPASSSRDRTIDITTKGARTGRSRRIEVWFYRSDGRIYLSTAPARRDWYANIVANPEFTFHLKHRVRADLRAIGIPVLDVVERQRVFQSIIDDLNQPTNPAGIAQPVEPLSEWMAGSPLIRVEFVEEDER